jgi:hypothetical protein
MGGKAVLELFTSEGCSSCPPADALLAALGARNDVIALAFHVDYWDDLGWKDPFGSPRWSARQAGYAAALDSGTYTPQLVVNGRTHVVGSDRLRAEALIQAAHAGTARDVSVEARRAGAAVQVTWDVAALAADERVLVVLTEDGLSSTVTRGENRGRTLAEPHVVRELVEVAGARGTTEIHADPGWGRLRAVVLVQRKGTLAIDGAAVGEVR